MVLSYINKEHLPYTHNVLSFLAEVFQIDLFGIDNFHFWHPTLCAFAAFNILLLTYLVGRHQKFTLLQVCCVVYTLVTSYRAVFPRDVLYKTCYVEIEHIMFSPIADRSLAAFAELCFSMQQVLWTKKIADQLKAKFEVPGVENVAKNVFYVIFFAQILCFCGVFTSYPLFHALENSLWGVCTGLIMLDASYFYYSLRPKLHLDVKWFLKFVFVIGSAFIMFLVTHDIPIWINLAFETTTVTPPNIGFQNSLTCTFTQEYKDWAHNIYWLLAYNSVAIWSSMYIAFFDLQLGGLTRKLSQTGLGDLSNLSNTLKLNLAHNFDQLHTDFKKVTNDFEKFSELLTSKTPEGTAPAKWGYLKTD